MSPIEMINTEQHEVIGWRDPSEIVENTPKRNVKVKNPPCFLISCTNESTKEALIKKIETLGGITCENHLKYDSKCTHLICERPGRSEKVLSSTAAGKWVLDLNYIHKSADANRFLDVSNFSFL